MKKGQTAYTKTTLQMAQSNQCAPNRISFHSPHFFFRTGEDAVKRCRAVQPADVSNSSRAPLKIQVDVYEFEMVRCVW